MCACESSVLVRTCVIRNVIIYIIPDQVAEISAINRIEVTGANAKWVGKIHLLGILVLRIDLAEKLLWGIRPRMIVVGRDDIGTDSMGVIRRVSVIIVGFVVSVCRRHTIVVIDGLHLLVSLYLRLLYGSRQVKPVSRIICPGYNIDLGVIIAIRYLNRI